MRPPSRYRRCRTGSSHRRHAASRSASGAIGPMYDPRVLTHDIAREPAASRRAGSFALIAAVLSVAVHAWLARGIFLPITVNGAVEYVFISATARSFFAIALVTSALLLL